MILDVNDGGGDNDGDNDDDGMMAMMNMVSTVRVMAEMR